MEVIRHMNWKGDTILVTLLIVLAIGAIWMDGDQALSLTNDIDTKMIIIIGRGILIALLIGLLYVVWKDTGIKGRV